MSPVLLYSNYYLESDFGGVNRPLLTFASVFSTVATADEIGSAQTDVLYLPGDSPYMTSSKPSATALLAISGYANGKFKCQNAEM